MADDNQINEGVDLEQEPNKKPDILFIFLIVMACIGVLGLIFNWPEWSAVLTCISGLAIVIGAIIRIVAYSMNKGAKKIEWGVVITALLVGAILFATGLISGLQLTEDDRTVGGLVDGVNPLGGVANTAWNAKSAYEATIVDGYEGMLEDVEFNTEEYNTVKENAFVSTKANPLSTLSADVDTASYCNVRRMINSGMKKSDIPSGAVRIEEMINYFDYDYQQVVSKHSEDKFDIQAESYQCPWNEDTQLLMFGFQAGEKPDTVNTASNLVFLIDVSGSMSEPDKLPLLRESFGVLVDNLNANDRVSIVTYASGEKIILEGASGNEKDKILSAINGLGAQGSTNGEAGLKQAYEIAERNYIDGGTNRIVMASDGDLNVGITSESELYDFVDKKRESGVYLSVLGFGGGNYKDNKMEVLADHGNGNYNYIDNKEEAVRVLQDKLRSNIISFADDVKVQVEFNPAQIKAYRLIGYENCDIADEDFRNDEVDAAEVGQGAQFTVLYEVVPVNSAMEIDEPELKYSEKSETAYSDGSASDEWLTCTLRYHDFDADKINEEVFPVEGGVVVTTPSDDWRFAAAVAEFGMLINDSKYAGTSSLDSINNLLNMQMNGQRSEFQDLVNRALR